MENRLWTKDSLIDPETSSEDDWQCEYSETQGAQWIHLKDPSTTLRMTNRGEYSVYS